MRDVGPRQVDRHPPDRLPRRLAPWRPAEPRSSRLARLLSLRRPTGGQGSNATDGTCEAAATCVSVPRRSRSARKRGQVSCPRGEKRHSERYRVIAGQRSTRTGRPARSTLRAAAWPEKPAVAHGHAAAGVTALAKSAHARARLGCEGSGCRWIPSQPCILMHGGLPR